MVDQVITKQELVDAQKDAQTLEDVVNGQSGELITTRLGRQVYTLASIPIINAVNRDEINGLIDPKADKVQVAADLSLKADKSTTYTKVETGSLVTPKADKSYVDNALAGFSNGAAKFYPTLAAANADIANIDVKDKVEVGEVANGGTWYKATAGATTLTKSPYDPLTQAKSYTDVAEANAKDYFKNNANVRFEANALSGINYTTADRNLTFSGTVFVITSAGTKTLTTPQVLNLPSNTRYRIEYNISTNTLRAVAYNASRSDSWALAGIVTVTTGGLVTSDFSYYVDGVAPVETPSEYGELINTIPGRIAFDTAAKTLTITSAVRVLSAGYTYIPPSTVVVDFPSTTGDYSLVFNKRSRTFSFKAQSTVSSKNDVVLAYITFAATTFKPTVTGISSYSIDGAAIDAGWQSEYGELTTDVATRINFSTIDKTLTITSSLVLSAGFVYVPSTSVTIPYPASSGLYSLVFSRSTRTFSFKGRTSVTAKNDIVLAKISFDASFVPTITGLEKYAVDGVAPSLVPSSVAVGVPVGFLVAINKSDINFDFTTKQLIIAESRVRLVATSYIPALLPAVTLDISGDEGFIKRLMYNTKTSIFRAIRANDPSAEDEIQVALFCVNTKFVDGVPYYQINGSDSTGQKDDLVKANFLVPYGKLDAEYTQPDLPAYTIMQTETQGDFTKMYALYDALMAQDPSHITKTVLGVDGLGNEIRQYQFNAPEVATVSTDHPKKPKIIIFSGVHGYEPTGVFNTFSAMKQIVERWKDDPHLEALYWGVNFIVVPVCNPSGFNTLNRYNHNDVDLARNFTAGWSAAQTNSGGSPMSQAETVIMDAVMSNNMDAIYCFSHHNFHVPTIGGDAGTFIWNASATSFGRYLAKTLIIGQTIRAKKRYPETMPQTNDYYIGYADNGAPPGSEGVQATKIYGIQGGTFEIANRWFWEAGTPPNSAIVATMGVETLINWLLLNVKYACELYNSKVNL